MISIFFIIVIVLINYLTDVCLGSSICVYNSEIGISAERCRETKISQSEFWGKEMPFVSASVALPLLVYNPALSASLLVAAFILFYVRK